MTDTRQARANKGNRIAVGVLIAVVSLFCFLSDVGALGGVGRMVYGFLVGFFGLASYAYSLMGIILGVALAFGLRRKQRLSGFLYLFGLLLIAIFALHVYTSSGHIIGANYGEYLLACYFNTNTAGGMLFGVLAFPIMKLLTSVGALALACAAFLLLALFGLIPSMRRNTVYKAASSAERRKEQREEKKSVSARGKRQRGDRIWGSREPAITDFSQMQNGARLYVVGIDGERTKTTAKKGSDGYQPISFNALYPNRNGAIEDEQRVAAPAAYTVPSPEKATYAPTSDYGAAAREILFGTGPSDENIARYEASKKNNLDPLTDVGELYRDPRERRQEMMEKLGSADAAKSEFITRRRAENAQDGDGAPSDGGGTSFEAIKQESLRQWRNSGAPMFESVARSTPSSAEVLRAEPVSGGDRKELARPTRSMPKIEEQSGATGSASGTGNVNVGMLGALNQAKTGEPAAAEPQKRAETVAEAYKTPQSSAPGAELARGQGMQDGYVSVPKPGLDSVRYMPSNTTKIPRAFTGDRNEQDERPSEAEQIKPEAFDPMNPISSAPAQAPKPAYNADGAMSFQPVKKVEPYKPTPAPSLETKPEEEDVSVPSEPLHVPTEITGGKMSAAAIQNATDIAHTSAKDKESAEMDARIENLKKSRGLTPAFTDSPSLKQEKAKAAARKGLPQDDGPRVYQPTLQQEIKKVEEPPKPKKPYVAPPLSLLNPPTEKLDADDDIEEKKELLIRTLDAFGITGEVESVVVGPTFTLYKVKVVLKKGTSVSSILNYSKDIAMNMEVESVRIQAPIPGMNAVGIEVPNKRRRTVNLSEILQSPEFNTAKAASTFAIGVDLYGKSHVANIAKLPHLLIAGQTGSGKSCGVNSLIVSLLYKATPDDVRFIIIDPKRVELSVYAGIPHLLMDEIICDMDKAAKAIAWAEQEMTRRTLFFQEAGYRDIIEYNSDLENSGYEKMPMIVIIIDEFAELMTMGKKPVEQSVGRLASLARAVGIHLVLATQRPSVDVISGTIRNNIPSRIAFTVSDSGSSRTILDTVGAEDLLGMGDMLYMEAGSSNLKRLQGAFISNAEVKRVVEFIKSHNECYFDQKAKDEIFNEKAEKKQEAAPKERKSPRTSPDLLAALELGIELRETDGKSFTTSFIQRRLGYGYQKAARIVDIIGEMDYIGVSPHDPKKTIVTMSREEFEEFKAAVEAENGDDEE